MGQSDNFQWLIMKYQSISNTTPSYSACVEYMLQVKFDSRLNFLAWVDSHFSIVS